MPLPRTNVASACRTTPRLNYGDTPWVHLTLSRPCRLGESPFVRLCPLIRYRFARLEGYTKCLTHLLSARCLVLQSGSGWPFIIDTLFCRTPKSRGSLLTSHPCRKWFRWATWGLPLTPMKVPLRLALIPRRRALLVTMKLLVHSTLPRALLSSSCTLLLLRITPFELVLRGRVVHRPSLFSLPSCWLVLACTEWNPRKLKTWQPSLMCPDPQIIGLGSLSPTVVVMMTSSGESRRTVESDVVTLKVCP